MFPKLGNDYLLYTMSLDIMYWVNCNVEIVFQSLKFSTQTSSAANIRYRFRPAVIRRNITYRCVPHYVLFTKSFLITQKKSRFVLQFIYWLAELIQTTEAFTQLVLQAEIEGGTALIGDAGKSFELNPPIPNSATSNPLQPSHYNIQSRRVTVENMSLMRSQQDPRAKHYMKYQNRERNDNDIQDDIATSNTKLVLLVQM